MYILPFLTRLSISGHLSCFHLLALVNGGAMQGWVQIGGIGLLKCEDELGTFLKCGP